MTEIPLRFISAAALPYARLTVLINQAFIDYFLPIFMGEVQFKQMCVEEDIDLHKSVVALVDETPVGIALFSQRDTRGWISGVGVLPYWRRRGIGQRIMLHVQTIAQTAHLESLTLEVLAQNEAATALYKHLGFEWHRDLLVLTLDTSDLTPAPLPPGITAEPAVTLLPAFEAFHDVPAPWQRDRRTLELRLTALHGLTFREAGRLIGYVLYLPLTHQQAIYDLAVDPAAPHRLPVARALLLALHQLRPDIGGYIINVPAADPLLPAFTGLHYRIWHRQYELVWQVPPVP